MGHAYFTCSECGAELGSRRVLAEHNRRVHPGTAQKNAGTSPKDRKVADM
jgi:hypothetical protein